MINDDDMIEINGIKYDRRPSNDEMPFVVVITCRDEYYVGSQFNKIKDEVILREAHKIRPKLIERDESYLATKGIQDMTEFFISKEVDLITICNLSHIIPIYGNAKDTILQAFTIIDNKDG